MAFQTLKVATGNSCNPAFVTMGLKIGTETYYKYLKSFGLMEKTGVDMIGEVAGIFADEDSFNSNVAPLAPTPSVRLSMSRRWS